MAQVVEVDMAASFAVEVSDLKSFQNIFGPLGGFRGSLAEASRKGRVGERMFSRKLAL